MALIVKSYVREGIYYGPIFTFEFAGDELPAHVHHEERSNHFTFVMRGPLEYFGHRDNEGVETKSGDFHAWPLGQPHGFRAKVAMAKIFNKLMIPVCADDAETIALIEKAHRQ